MLDHPLVLKKDELFLVGNDAMNRGAEHGAGLYVRDTRHLSQFRVTLNGQRLTVLSARMLDGGLAVVTAANEGFALGDGTTVLPLTVSVEQQIALDTRLRVRFVVRNFHTSALTIDLRLDAAADFRDLFDVRGFQRKGRGTSLTPVLSPDRVTLGYEGVDGLRARTVISFDRPASLVEGASADNGADAGMTALLPGFDRVAPAAPAPPPNVIAAFVAEIAQGASWELNATITLEPAAPTANVSGRQTVSDAPPATVTTDDPRLNRVLERGAADLAMLETTFPDGALAAAGIPWYVAPFGRDSLIVGLQTLHLAPERAARTLRTLASLQGTLVDRWREEEPGKILHEIRYGEMARRHEVPHTPYYGSVDATPLFVLLFAETVNWTGDDGLYDELLTHVRRALYWIEEYGDLDGDGLIEYASQPADGTHIVHQGWKDSLDSLNTPDGRPVSGNIALVEVQGYVFAALTRLAEVVAARGDAKWADRLRQRAEALRAAVEERFWLPAEGFYAQALDGNKTPVEAMSSNPGHLLFCELPSAERAALVAKRFLASDLFSGWGVRTLSTRMTSYNPMSYHNGSIWPHDNSLIVAGLHAYGLTDAANRITASLLDASNIDPLGRLPELYCGFARAESASDVPVGYPVSCSPQAWAAAAPALMVRGMLRLRVDPRTNRLVATPSLPSWVGEVSLRGLRFRGDDVSFTVCRRGTRYDVEASGPIKVGASSAIFDRR